MKGIKIDGQQLIQRWYKEKSKRPKAGKGKEAAAGKSSSKGKKKAV
jgi:hypothetical protein